MTPETERERRANQIVKHADRYGSDADFRMMVDNTVYLTPEQIRTAEQDVLSTFGTRNNEFMELRAQREYGT